ncbi:hypothetical protein [Arthrobacter sp. KNU40]|uniref:hypothetical protein n=1 Tax=Arthrobacter sp. KNU40 TaxID=3447965 RepID=UPI003F63425A
MDNIWLGTGFIRETTEQPLEVEYLGKQVKISKNSPGDNVIVTQNGEPLGYITHYGEHESGAVSIALNGHVLPQICRTLRQALEVICDS